MKRISYILILLTVFCYPVLMFGQGAKDSIPSIKVIAKVNKAEVILRWAVNDAVAWEYSNKYGYKIERYTLVKKGRVTNNSEVVLLTSSPVLPKSEEAWVSPSQTDKYVAIAAQAIFGKTFELNEKITDVYQLLNKAKETENRFSFALFCADQSTEAAELLGVRYSDKTIQEGERYLYKVYSLIPSTLLKVDTGFVFVDADKLTVYPKPTQLKAEFSDRTVMLSWNKLYYDSYYSSYVLERSDDEGKTFKEVHSNSFLNASPVPDKKSELMFKVDSLPENNKKYIYRIKGKSYFGDYGPYSDLVEGKGIARPMALPVITGGKVLDNKSIQLTWTFPNSSNSKIRGFKIAVAGNANGPYKNLKNEFTSDVREFLYEDAKAANYFVIKAIDFAGKEYPSTPKLVQLKDNTPPSAPTGIKGIIDSNGVVTINWLSNKEADVLGYRVYMANSLNDEFTQVTKTHLFDTVFNHNISLKSLTENIYFKIVAIDNHFNPSVLSEPLKLKKPDFIPPVAPQFKNMVATDTGIVLQWTASPSKDVAGIILLRKLAESFAWDELNVLSPNETIYIDKNLRPGLYYEYALIAVDDSKNRSSKSQTLKTRLPDHGIRPAIEKIESIVDRTKQEVYLKWDYSTYNIERFQVYRSADGSAMRLYKTLEGTTLEFKDKNIIVNTIYKYQIRAKFKDGGASPFCKEIIVNY